MEAGEAYEDLSSGESEREVLVLTGENGGDACNSA
jgi:hypothetical protein